MVYLLESRRKHAASWINYTALGMTGDEQAPLFRKKQEAGNRARL
jgi:hypothetical protein